MGANPGGLRFYYDTLSPGLAAFGPKLAAGIYATFEYYADRATAYARSNAPWTDRTGNARNGLNAVAFSDDSKSVIVIFHQMPYGIWLEVRNAGQYAIIMPTIDAIGPELMDTLNKLLARLG